MRLFLLLLVGCGGTSGVIDLDEPGSDPTGDSGDVTGDADTDADTDTDTDTDADGDTDTDPEPEPEPDFSFWKGERVISRDGCKEIISETGERLPESWEYYDAAKEVCPECEHFYYIALSPTEACGIEFSPESFRSFSLDSEGGSDVLVWDSQRYDYVPLAEDGQLEGQELTYAYDFDYDRDEVEVDGIVIFDGTWK